MKPCCQDEANRERVEAESSEDLAVTHCRVCGCRHYELEVEVGKIGVEGAAL